MEVTELLFAIGGFFIGILVKLPYYHRKVREEGYNQGIRDCFNAKEWAKDTIDKINWD